MAPRRSPISVFGCRTSRRPPHLRSGSDRREVPTSREDTARRCINNICGSPEYSLNVRTRPSPPFSWGIAYVPCYQVQDASSRALRGIGLGRGARQGSRKTPRASRRSEFRSRSFRIRPSCSGEPSWSTSSARSAPGVGPERDRDPGVQRSEPGLFAHHGEVARGRDDALEVHRPTSTPGVGGGCLGIVAALGPDAVGAAAGVGRSGEPEVDGQPQRQLAGSDAGAKPA